MNQNILWFNYQPEVGQPQRRYCAHVGAETLCELQRQSASLALEPAIDMKRESLN
jgi:hypothetical protein